MTFGNRVTIALVSLVLSLPAGCGAGLFLLDRGLGDDSVHSNDIPTALVLLALLVLGVVFVHEIGRRLTGSKIDGHDFSMGALAICTVSGLFLGLYIAGFSRLAPSAAFGVLIAVAGLSAFAGTYLSFGSRRRPKEPS